jgi:hypothetical protein
MTSSKSSKTTHPALYRVYQFFVALKASLPFWAGGVRDGMSTTDEALVTSILKTPAQYHLFDQMPPNDQRHAIAVVRTLQQVGYNQPALMQAALLHDVGKGMGQPLIHRVLIVLFNAFWPGALIWLSREAASQPADTIDTSRSLQLDHNTFTLRPSIQKAGWWRRPFVIHARHPAIGAAWAEEAGCDPLAVRLIARHQDILAEPTSAEENLLTALQWADDLN